MTPRYTILCHECGEEHPAHYDHEGQWGEGPIYVVICDDGLADYYTAELLIVRPDATPTLDLTREDTK